jgi:hypothetical protein
MRATLPSHTSSSESRVMAWLGCRRTCCAWCPQGHHPWGKIARAGYVVECQTALMSMPSCRSGSGCCCSDCGDSSARTRDTSDTRKLPRRVAGVVPLLLPPASLRPGVTGGSCNAVLSCATGVISGGGLQRVPLLPPVMLSTEKRRAHSLSWPWLAVLGCAGCSGDSEAAATAVCGRRPPPRCRRR